MDQQLKQRLVGVAVIFSLAVIFLPLILDGSGRQLEELNVVIPPKPQLVSEVKVEEKVIELERKAEQLQPLQPIIVDEVSEPPAAPEKTNSNLQAKTESNEKTVIKPETEATPSATEKPAPKQTGGDSWVIQVGSFGDRDKAYALRDQLRKSRLSSVFIERYQHQGQSRYRVRMGPFIEKKKAQVVQNKVMAKYNLKGLVMRYEK